MTATEPASLDALLANATPVEAEPFDLGRALIRHRLGQTDEAIACLQAIVRHVNAERVRTEDARRWVDRLQGECADKDRRIKEALGYLGDALVWCNDGYSNTADCISEAIAALKGES